MKLFDSHCHLDDKVFAKDLIPVLQRARMAGVRRLITVGIDQRSSARALEIAKSFQGIYASIGFHPHTARHCSESALTSLRTLARDPKVKAWGEIGLDFNRMFSPPADQEKWFVRQMVLAAELDLPVILHERDSGGRLLELLKQHFGKTRQGVIHCFSGNSLELEAYLQLGLFIGITGILTLDLRGERLRSLVTEIPSERLLIETDAPYLTPVPQKNRHRRNEPAFVKSTFLRLAEVRQEDPGLLADVIWKNTCRLLKIDH